MRMGTMMMAGMCLGLTGVAQEQAKVVGSRIQRTMTLLATSTAERRNPVKILFYGQSIVRQDYARKAIEADLRKRFLHADLVVENRAIGGYTAPALIRTAEQDLYPFYPDLVVFHVYGGEKGGEFEGILRTIRQRTTAEILTWTHHPDRRGIDNPGHESACTHRREMAEKYSCEMVDLRETWKAHIRANNQKVDEFLTDVVHLNKHGGKLMGDILVPAFQYHPELPPTWEGTVREVSMSDALAGKAEGVVLSGDWQVKGRGVAGNKGTITVRFKGNRIDLTALPLSGKLGTARILVDGMAPSAHPKAYAATLPTRSPIDYRPALKQIQLGGDPKVEEWTLTAHDISEEGKQFAFDVAGSVTGPDGSGTHEGTFVSNSKRITLQPRDFSFAEAIRIRKKPLPETFKVTWNVCFMGMDEWKPKPIADAAKVDRYTLIQGIDNAEHMVEIILNGNGPVAIESLTLHRPPLE